MASQRRKLKVNPNDSKNTRMDIAEAGILANWRPDELAHISRYCKIAEHIMDEAKRLGRPLDIFEVGCGQVWPLRYLYKAIICKKEEQVREYIGYDIDPIALEDIWQEKPVNEASWLQIFGGRVTIQDLTIDPDFFESKAEDGLFDFFYSTEVIEHMKPEFVEPWIKNAASMLRPGGLAYISTPNHDGSKDKLPEDHVYEWGFNELKELLEKHFEIVRVDGVFTQMNNFKRAWKQDTSASRVPDYVVKLIEHRFDPHWQRVILGMFYPEFANNCAWTLRKKEDDQ